MLSHTVPGVQAGTDAATARDHARFANDYLARVVAEYPTGCADPPTTPAAPSKVQSQQPRKARK